MTSELVKAGIYVSMVLTLVVMMVGWKQEKHMSLRAQAQLAVGVAVGWVVSGGFMVADEAIRDRPILAVVWGACAGLNCASHLARARVLRKRDQMNRSRS